MSRSPKKNKILETNNHFKIEPGDKPQSGRSAPAQLIPLREKKFLAEKLDLLKKKYNNLLIENKELKKIATLDEKTSLLRYKPDHLTNLIKTYSRFPKIQTSKKLNIVLIRFDIDNFSKINNQFGHKTGDKVLLKISQVFKENSRSIDYLIRFGGDEFDVLLGDSDLAQAKIYLNKILNKIEKVKIVKNKTKIIISLSAGITKTVYHFRPNSKIDSKDILKKFKQIQDEADRALYQAKSLGRNKLYFYKQK